MAEVTTRDDHDATASSAPEDMLLVNGRGLIKETYLKQGFQGVISRRSALKTLLATRSIPTVGLDDMTIEMILSELAAMDSNNFLGNCGLGEREGRVFSPLVQKRHFHLSHGIGRSGDLQEEQPKAAGSSIIYKLTSYLALQALHKMSLTSMRKCLVVPVATGMTLALCMMTLRTQRSTARYVIWSRIDQKSCFKSILTAGFVPLVVDTVRIGDSLHTDCGRIEALVVEYGSENILVS
jgi:O-phospho-L-seryl-tRNASec:L-selenocysteinyl-tRNA synthase